MNTHLAGKDVPRIDGPAKVSGAAKYAAEFFAPAMAYAVAVCATIARCEITSVDTTAAMEVGGALEVFTHKNRPNLPWFDRSYRDEDAPADGSPLRPLYNAKIQYNGQPVVLCVAETFEAARAMTRLVRVAYKSETHQTCMSVALTDAKFVKRSNRAGIEGPPKSRGNFGQAYADAPVKLAAMYEMASEIHNPIELFATTVVYHDNDTLTIYDKTQSVSNSKKYVCDIFGLPSNDVRVESPFVGGALGAALRPQYQLYLATLAAIAMKRSVRLALTRDQMFKLGHRAATMQEIRLGSSIDGSLLALESTSFQATSRYENFFDAITNWAGLSYRCDNVTTGEMTVAMDISSPADMRAPGAAQGVWAIELPWMSSRWLPG